MHLFSLYYQLVSNRLCLILTSNLIMNDQEILQSIESGDFAAADSILRQAINKNPKNLLFPALKYYNRYRQNNSKDAISGTIEISSKKPVDPRITNVLSKVLYNENRNKDVITTYENAIKYSPSDPITKLLVNQWFENSVNHNEIIGLQKSCFQLSKIYGDRKHKYMSAFSNYLLAKKSHDDPKLYNLYCTLGYKFIESFTPETTQELFVAVKTLDNNPEKAVQVIELYAGQLDLDVKLEYLKLIEQLHDYGKLHQVTTKYLFDDKFDDFDTWKLYILSGQKVGVLFDELERNILGYTWSRNSQLALVELCKVFESDKFDFYILQYYRKLKSKLCCFTDLVSYVDNSETLVKELHRCSKDTKLKDKNASNLNILVNNQKLLHYFGECGPEFFKTNLEIYESFLPLVDTKEATDFYAANELILINVIHSLNKNSSFENIYKNIIVLEYLASKDMLDFRVNLWLARLLKLVGLAPQVHQIYDHLKIRMIQNDSLGYLITQDASHTYPTKQMLNYLINIFRFYLTCEGDLQENVIQAFNEGVYTKIENFMGFSEKLKNSVQYYELFVEILQLIRVLGDTSVVGYFRNRFLDVVKQVEKISFSDNRDRKIYWKSLGFKPNFIDDFESKLELFGSHELNYLKLNYIKEQMILQPSESTFKLFNKNLSNVKLPKAEAWIMKIYLHLFKLNNKLEKPEFDSTINFLRKNLKVSKIPVSEPLDGNNNRIIHQVIDVLKYAKSLGNKELSSLVSDIKIGNVYKVNQLDRLDELKGQLGEFHLNITKEFIDSNFDKYHDTLIKCSYIHQKF